jgi:phosphate transport system protein
MSVHLDREISKLKKKIMQIATMTEENVRRAVLSVNSRDEKLANEVIERDEELDRFEVEIEEECLKILALHQPVATDLRYVVACLKINNDLERVGDLAVNIAQRAAAIASNKEDAIPVDFNLIMDSAQRMFTKSLDAMMEVNTALAREVCEMDNETDDLNRGIHEEIIQMIKDKPRKAKYFLHLLGVSRQLERIADYATNIAEDVIYMTEGKIIRHCDPVG